MYESYFSLKELPFNQVSSTHFFFASSNYREVLSTLQMAIRTGEGFVKIIGKAGTGKTILCRKFVTQLNDHCVVAHITCPCTDSLQLLLTLAGEFSIPVQDETDEHQLIVLLTKQFLRYLNAKKRVVLCFDEAQAISRECLKTLYLLTHFKAKNKKRPQVILFGQPELNAQLAHPSMRRLQQRIVFQCQLNGLRQNEIIPYLHHRLQVAGYRGRQIFSHSAICWMYRLSGGIPRMVNYIAHQSLLFVLREGVHEVLPKHVKQSAPDSEAMQDSWLEGVRECFFPSLQHSAWLFAPFVLLLTAGSIWLFTGLSTGTNAAMIPHKSNAVIPVAVSDGFMALNSQMIPLAARSHVQHVSPLIERTQGQGAAPKTRVASDRINKPSLNSLRFPPARKPIRQVDSVSNNAYSQQRDENRFEKVSALIRNGNHALALEECFKILNANAKHDEARLALTKLLLKEGRLDEAESILIEGIQISLGQVMFAKTLAQIQLQRGDIDVALNTLQYSLPKAIGQADYHALLASLLQRQLRHGEAIKHYQTAVSLVPGKGQWLLALGISLQQKGYFSEAREMFVRAKKSQALGGDLLALVDRRIAQVQPVNN